MSEDEFDLAAQAWLDDGPTRMSDRAVLSALEEIHATRQRRAMWSTWRATPVSIFSRVGIAAVLMVAVGLLAITVLPRQSDRSSVGGLSPSPSVDFPDLTTTFVSPRNGFSIKHPDGAALTPARQPWGVSKQVDDGFDVMETGLGAIFKGTSTPSIPPDVTIDAWVDEYVSPGDCTPRSQQAAITIDGQSGRVSECPDGIVATVVAGGRLYLFTLSDTRTDARAVFDAFAATIDLTPETAVDIPNLTSTFVSPTYGLAFGYLDRGEGTLAPAKELWDPGDEQLDDIQHTDRFDAVETGLGAYFVGASTAIPDGVSVDAWYDAHVSPSGCGVPRSQQAEVTIDGHAGRIAECRDADGTDLTEATVDAGGRLYLFMLGRQRSDARAWFDAWVATIDLRPEDAALPSSAPPS